MCSYCVFILFILDSLHDCVFTSATDCPDETDICTSTEEHLVVRKSHAVTTSDIRQAETELCSAMSRLTLSDSTKLNPNAVSSNINIAESEEEKRGL